MFADDEVVEETELRCGRGREGSDMLRYIK
jgi:hypothetical protein